MRERPTARLRPYWDKKTGDPIYYVVCVVCQGEMACDKHGHWGWPDASPLRCPACGEMYR
jgi:hypothetical protein